MNQRLSLAHGYSLRVCTAWPYLPVPRPHNLLATACAAAALHWAHTENQAADEAAQAADGVTVVEKGGATCAFACKRFCLQSAA